MVSSPGVQGLVGLSLDIGGVVPDGVLVQGVLSADEGHLDVFSAQSLLQRDLLHRVLVLQRPPVRQVGL